MQRLLLMALGLGVMLGTGFYYLQGASARSALASRQAVTDARGSNVGAGKDANDGRQPVDGR